MCVCECVFVFICHSEAFLGQLPATGWVEVTMRSKLTWTEDTFYLYSKYFFGITFDCGDTSHYHI